MEFYRNDDIQKLNRFDNNLVRNGYLRLDMNENPSGLPKEFVDRIKKRITPEFLSEYPNVYPFVESYSKHIGVSPSKIRPTNGSDMGIRMIFEIFGKKGTKVVTVSPSFEMYRIYSEMHGLIHTPVRYSDDFEYPVEKMIDTIDEDTSIVSILNPNNPIGDLIPKKDIARIIEKATSVGAVVVIDEAYHYFCDSSCIDLIDKYDNVIVLRTFSKIFSIAACRLGVVISNEKIISLIFNAQPSFDVNSIALMVGKELIDSNIIDDLKRTFFEGKEYFEKWLVDNKYQYIKSNGNYMSFVPRTDSHLLSDRLKEEGILVKTYSDPLLKRYIRISIGEKDVMMRFTAALNRLDRND